MKTVFIILSGGMYVCVCLAVTDTTVRETIENGASSRQAVTRQCGAGGDCGACHNMIEDMIEDHLDACAAPCTASGSSTVLLPSEQLVRPRAQDAA